MDDFIILSGSDNVAVALKPMKAGITTALRLWVTTAETGE